MACAVGDCNVGSGRSSLRCDKAECSNRLDDVDDGGGDVEIRRWDRDVTLGLSEALPFGNDLRTPAGNPCVGFDTGFYDWVFEADVLSLCLSGSGEEMNINHEWQIVDRPRKGVAIIGADDGATYEMDDNRAERLVLLWNLHLGELNRDLRKRSK